MARHAVILVIGTTNHHSQLTYDRAHAMLPALGKPLVVRIMARLYRIGIRKYTVIVGTNEGAVAAYLSSQWMPDVEIEFILKPNNESLFQLLRKIALKHKEPFLLCSYNSFTHTHFPERLLKLHTENPDLLVLGAANNTLSNSHQHYYTVMKGDKVTDITKLPQPGQQSFTLTDFMVFGCDVIKYLVGDHGDPNRHEFNWQVMDIARQYIRSGKEGIVAETSWILQVEADRDLITLNKHLLDEAHDAHILSELPYTVEITAPVRIDPQVSVGQGAKIGPHVYLERGCSVGHDAVILNSIILEHSVVPSGKTIMNTIITQRGPIQ